MPTHIVSSFEVYDASILDAIVLLGSLLKQEPSSFKFWSNTDAASEYKQHDISVMRPYASIFPSGGNLIVLGASTRVGHWYRYQDFESVTLVHLTLTQEAFYQSMHQLSEAGKHNVNIIYANSKIKRLIGLEGAVLSD